MSRSFKSNGFSFVLPWLYWSPTVIFCASSFYVPKQISGQSMQPTLNPDTSSAKDIGLFDRASVRLSRDFRKDDIVAFRSPEDRNHVFVKRIVGLEGDTVKTLPPYPHAAVRVPPGHVWVEGDEPYFSDDSNLFGPIPAALIDAKLVGILWPLRRFGPLPKPKLPSTGNGPAFQNASAAFEKDGSRKARVNSVITP